MVPGEFEGVGPVGAWCLVLGAWCGTSAFPEGAFAEGCDLSERVPGRWRIDAGGWIPPAASMKLIAEYDSRTFNMGLIASFWDDCLEAMFELMAMKWVNFGVRYKLMLKK